MKFPDHIIRYIKDGLNLKELNESKKYRKFQITFNSFYFVNKETGMILCGEYIYRSIPCFEIIGQIGKWEKENGHGL